MQREVYTNIITGKLGVDAFDKFVADWYARAASSWKTRQPPVSGFYQNNQICVGVKPMTVRYGVCTDFEYLEGLAQAGYDYIEPKTYDIALAPDSAFEAMRRRRSKARSPASLKFFYPPDSAWWEKTSIFREYTPISARRFARTGELGVKNITIGSGPARTVRRDSPGRPPPGSLATRSVRGEWP